MIYIYNIYDIYIYNIYDIYIQYICTYICVYKYYISIYKVPGLAMCRGKLSTLIARLLSKCLRSGWKW